MFIAQNYLTMKPFYRLKSTIARLERVSTIKHLFKFELINSKPLGHVDEVKSVAEFKIAGSEIN